MQGISWRLYGRLKGSDHTGLPLRCLGFCGVRNNPAMINQGQISEANLRYLHIFSIF